MSNTTPDVIFRLLLSLPAFICGFALHEFGHAWMANRLGDDTPRRMGRLTLDPLAHLDPIGSIMFVLTALTGYGIGWAKPVPFNPRNFENPRVGMMLVAIAGPVTNLLQVPFWFCGLWLTRVVLMPNPALLAQAGSDYSAPVIVATVFQYGLFVNLLLAAFNMIPFPPLDGHWILEGLGPPAISDLYRSLRPLGVLPIFLLTFIPSTNNSILDMIVSPAMRLGEILFGLAMGVRF